MKARNVRPAIRDDAETREAILGFLRSLNLTDSTYSRRLDEQLRSRGIAQPGKDPRDERTIAQYVQASGSVDMTFTNTAGRKQFINSYVRRIQFNREVATVLPGLPVAVTEIRLNGTCKIMYMFRDSSTIEWGTRVRPLMPRDTSFR